MLRSVRRCATRVVRLTIICCLVRGDTVRRRLLVMMLILRIVVVNAVRVRRLRLVKVLVSGRRSLLLSVGLTRCSLSVLNVGRR